MVKTLKQDIEGNYYLQEGNDVKTIESVDLNVLIKILLDKGVITNSDILTKKSELAALKQL